MQDSLSARSSKPAQSSAFIIRQIGRSYRPIVRWYDRANRNRCLFRT